MCSECVATSAIKNKKGYTIKLYSNKNNCKYAFSLKVVSLEDKNKGIFGPASFQIGINEVFSPEIETNNLVDAIAWFELAGNDSTTFIRAELRDWIEDGGPVPIPPM